MSKPEMNADVSRTLEMLSPDMSDILGNGGPSLGVGPPPMPVPGMPTPKSMAADKAATNKAAAQTLADNSSVKGMDHLAVRKFPKIAALLPGAEKIRIRQRREDGSLATVGNYNKTDVDGVGEIESFIQQYLEPKHGGGEYDVVIIDAQGKEWPAGIVKLMSPPRYPTASTSAAPSTSDPLMVEMFRHVTKPPAPQPDALTQLRNAKEFLVDMQPKNTGPDTSMFTAMMQMQMQAQTAQAAQQAESTKMFLAMMQQQSAAASAARPAVDPAITSLLERMDRRLEKLEAAPPPMPPMPPMPPPGPSWSMPELITAISSAVAMVVPLVKNESGPTAVEMAGLIIQAQQAARPTDGLGVKDVIEIFQRREAESAPPATLEEQIGTLVRVKELAAAVAPPPPPPSQTGTTFWDAAINIFGPGSEISRAIGARVDATPPLAPRPVVITDNRSVQRAPAQITEQASPPIDEVPLPANFQAKMQAMTNANTPGERVQSTIDALLSLQPIQRWQGFLQGLLGAIAMNPVNPHESLKALGGWLKILIDGGLLPGETAMATLVAFKENYVVVRAGIIEKIPAIRSMAQQADAAHAAAAAQAPVAEPTPADGAPAPDAEGDGSDVPEEGSGEKPTGPAPAVLEGFDGDAAAYSGGY